MTFTSSKCSLQAHIGKLWAFQWKMAALPGYAASSSSAGLRAPAMIFSAMLCGTTS